MSAATKVLPAGWSSFLDEVQLHLDRAIASVDANYMSVPSEADALASTERLRDIAQWSEQLRRLSAHLESAEQIVQSVDEILQQEASRLRAIQSSCATFQHRLAAGQGSAIG